ncbi:Alpha/Beta hydrolase protein [Pseudoneurospora amorphoporcata]|uniref:Alpha/Beta hydrolase protein n=1 Tax=Pseudoneurospora amorphoporcata TaxID=241081 RepID=A0AAN6NUI5_9PEZI|nr:Alpha/Beta hydrolase protein [Pseudoneurospora amorphoporcata]
MASQEEPGTSIPPHVLSKLNPDFVQFFWDVLSNRPRDVSIEELRAHPEKYRAPTAIDTSKCERVADYEVTSEDGAKIPVRVYHPDPEKHGNGPYPVHLNHHGGGFVIGDLFTDGQLCLSMREAGVVVVDVNYRHCPETMFGKAFQDAWAAIQWVINCSTTLNIDASSVSVGGISAGGHISFVLQHMARDAGLALKLCLASVPPATDCLSYDSPADSPYPSFSEFANGPVLPWDRIKYFGQAVFPPEMRDEIRKMWPEWWLAPIKAPNFKGLCPTFIRTAECDMLRDEGEAYGLKLVEGGNKVMIKRYLGAVHTMMYLALENDQRRSYDEDAIRALREAHGLAK